MNFSKSVSCDKTSGYGSAFGFDAGIDHSYCNNNEAKTEAVAKFHEEVARVSKTLVEGFNECIHHDGFHIWVGTHPESMGFTINARLNNTRPATFRIDFSPARFVENCVGHTKPELHQGVTMTMNGTWQVTCEVNGSPFKYAKRILPLRSKKSGKMPGQRSAALSSYTVGALITRVTKKFKPGIYDEIAQRTSTANT